MSQSVKRRGGKPNRGGGRFNNKPRGRVGGGRGRGGGPGSSRKGANAMYDEGGPLVMHKIDDRYDIQIMHYLSYSMKIIYDSVYLCNDCLFLMITMQEARGSKESETIAWKPFCNTGSYEFLSFEFSASSVLFFPYFHC
jgi:hypothetical protein